MASKPVTASASTTIHEIGPSRGFRSLRLRMYVQIFAAVLPLAALLVYESVLVSVMVRDVNFGLTISQLATGAQESYREFVNGVTDAVDTGSVGPKAIEALHDALGQLRDLEAAQPSEELRGAIDEVNRVDSALNSSNSLKTLLPLRSDVNGAASAIKATAAKIEKELGNRVAEEQASGRKREIILIGLTLATLAALAWTLGHMITSITYPISMAVNVTNRVTDGDLTGEVEIKTRDELGELQAALLNMHIALTEIVADVRRASQDIAAATTNIADGNADLARRTELQGESLAKIRDSAVQLRDTVAGNARESEKASEVATRTAEVAARGGETVDQVVDTMRSIYASSKQVVDFIGSIQNIAFQTNILAINAAVEAARAGDSGRGFAVVAAEVQALANRSESIAKDAQELIGKTFVRVKDGTQLVEQAGRQMQEIIASVQSLAETTHTVMQVSQRQQRDTDAVASTVTQIDEMTRENSAFVQDAERASAAVRERASDLDQIVGRFKLMRHSRHTVNWEANGSFGGKRFAGIVRDISVTGMRLETDVTFKVGQPMRVLVQSARDGFASPVYFECQVVKTRGAGERLPHVYGVTFKRIREADRRATREWFIRATEDAGGTQQLQAQRSGLTEIERLPATLEADHESQPTPAADMRLAS
jgi:methyl-accepting chemotaxis protein